MKKSMKKIACLALAALLSVSVLGGCSKQADSKETMTETAAGNSKDGVKPGVYEGTAKGFGGDVVAKLTIAADGSIEALEITGDQETEDIGGAAIKLLQADILSKQTSNVDAVSSATVTSTAVIEAVNAALESAGIDPASLTGISEQAGEMKEEVIDTDIVIIGGGGAGMTAAITAKQEGLNVIIVEKMPMVGGNTTKATGGMNAAETKYQKALNIEDSIETFIQDTMTGGKDINNKELVTIMAEKSSDAIDWLDTINAPLPKVSFSGGATNSRIHAPEDGSAVGSYLISAFSKQLEELDVPVYLNTKATELVITDGTVTGILAESKDTKYTINAKAVILATGGFGANEEMYTKYREDLKGYVTTNTPGATGDGIVLAEAIHADLVDIEQIQIHPTVEQTTSIMVTEAVRGDGAILVNKNGERFINELLTRDVVSAGIIEQEDGSAYIIFDQTLRENLAAIEKYISSNIVTEAPTIEELAAALEMEPTVLAETLNTWNAAVDSQDDQAFSRTTGMEHNLTTAPYYAIKIAPGVHHTMGGVKINTNCEVIDTEGNVISGLYAAGEVTGGIHGGNRIGGNAVADIVVFGRIAGASAAEAVKAK